MISHARHIVETKRKIVASIFWPEQVGCRKEVTRSRQSMKVKSPEKQRMVPRNVSMESKHEKWLFNQAAANPGATFSGVLRAALDLAMEVDDVRNNDQCHGDANPNKGSARRRPRPPKQGRDPGATIHAGSKQPGIHAQSVVSKSTSRSPNAPATNSTRTNATNGHTNR